MARTRINPRLAKLHRSYSVFEVAELFRAHANTVRAWLKSGLTPIDAGRPVLIQGKALRAFLESRRSTAKRPCPPGTLYCLKCRAPRQPALGMAEFAAREVGAGNLRALCDTCGTVMNRRANAATISTILPEIEVQTVRAAPRIKERSTPCLNCD